ncbi:hypothetical protein TRVL_03802 [Trypanosoma vivax]|nr:hypothetical protein TRVL_03802 [Trypanosoma vivax]
MLGRNRSTHATSGLTHRSECLRAPLFGQRPVPGRCHSLLLSSRPATPSRPVSPSAASHSKATFATLGPLFRPDGRSVGRQRRLSMSALFALTRGHSTFLSGAFDAGLAFAAVLLVVVTRLPNTSSAASSISPRHPLTLQIMHLLRAPSWQPFH